MATVLVIDWFYVAEEVKRVVAGVTVVDGKDTVTHDDRYRVALPAVEKLLATNPDVVVVGNLLRVGEGVIPLIPDDLRGKTLIVWGDPPTDRDKAPYLLLGITHFGTRRDAGFLVRAMLAERSASSPDMLGDVASGDIKL